MKNSLLIAFILLNCITAKAQFQKCNTPTTNNLMDIYFMDSQTGIAVGDSGTILRSTDGGLNWTSVLNIGNIKFTKVEFFNTQVGIALGTQLYKTLDGGQTWARIQHSNTSFFDIEIVNNNTCYISGTPTSLIKSTNAGLTFVDLITVTNPNIGILSFINDTIGYSCMFTGGASTETSKTIDGGQTWSIIKDSVSFNNPTVMEAMSFISEDVGFKAGWYNAHLEKTVNGANLWSIPSRDTINSGQILDIHIKANMPNAYYACGWYGELYKSTNGGNHWFSISSGVSNVTSLNGIYFLNNDTGWVAGNFGTVLKTVSGGLSLDENKLDVNIDIYPNPAQDRIFIGTTEKINITEVVICDLLGRQTIRTKSIETGVDVSKLANGVYVLYIKSEIGSIRRKFTKK